ncbi:MAG: dehydrogenase, partial [Variovorax sp.]
MSYMLLIHEPVGQRAERTETEGRARYDEMLQWGAGLQARGVLKAGESLTDTAHATRVQVRGGRAQLLDGPFAEAKEMVGGFFLLDVGTREEALTIAASCPAAQWCTVEVRA